MILGELSIERPRGDHLGVSVSQGLRADLQSTFGKSDGLVQIALLLVEDGKIIQRLSCLRVVRTEMLFTDLQGALKQLPGLLIRPLPEIQGCQPTKGKSQLGMIWPPRPAPRCAKLSDSNVQFARSFPFEHKVRPDSSADRPD